MVVYNREGEKKSILLKYKYSTRRNIHVVPTELNSFIYNKDLSGKNLTIFSLLWFILSFIHVSQVVHKGAKIRFFR